MPKKRGKGGRVPHLQRYWVIAGALAAGLLLAVGGWFAARDHAPEPTEAPEAQRVLDVQSSMPFQILIPAYMPKAFDRTRLEIDVNRSGPGGEPMVQLAYRTRKGASLFVRQWVPVNPAMEVLAASRPIETKWGKGWLLRQGDSMTCIWVDIGPLRISIYTPDVAILPDEQLLAIAETMGPASNRQVFNFILDPPQVKEVPPPPPVEAQTNAEGVQKVDLIVTPGGYSPLRFAVKQGVPVRLVFRQLGEVGCGNELNVPLGDGRTASLYLQSPADTEVLDFTPEKAGEFQFYCAHLMYRGVMVVH